MATEFAFVVERPNSDPSRPDYLSFFGDEKHRRFIWTPVPYHALRFANEESAEQVAAISKTAQPDLWQTVVSIGNPRVRQHGWD